MCAVCVLCGCGVLCVVCCVCVCCVLCFVCYVVCCWFSLHPAPTPLRRTPLFRTHLFRTPTTNTNHNHNNKQQQPQNQPPTTHKTNNNTQQNTQQNTTTHNNKQTNNTTTQHTQHTTQHTSKNTTQNNTNTHTHNNPHQHQPEHNTTHKNGLAKIGLAKVGLNRMTALQKSSGGVRGIVVGDFLRRLVARTLAQQLAPAVERATSPFQFALTTKLGCECVAHIAQTLLIWLGTPPCCLWTALVRSISSLEALCCKDSWRWKVDPPLSFS